VSGTDPDPLLRRLERRALWFCVLAALSAVALQRGRLEFALGVLGGGLLIGLSYWAIRSSIDGLLALAAAGRVAPAGDTEPTPGPSEAARPGPGSRRYRAFGFVLRFVGRYAVLGTFAYVMVVWLGLHPVGLMLGVSSIVVAAAVEVVSAPGRRRATGD
jgi:hypothetical protein